MERRYSPAANDKTYVGSSAVVTQAGATRTVNYLLTDRLGSVDAVASASGALIETRGYDAFGKPRTGTWANASPPRLGTTTNTPHGFTGHEHLNLLELIHMNGRVYDYNLGRFTGVDPVIQFPLNSQSLNPYSYILNNPLSGTDPTGYQEKCAGGEGANCSNEDNKHEDREAPTGSHIASNTRYSGQVTGLDKTGSMSTVKYSATVNRDGQMLSGSISCSNGCSNVSGSSTGGRNSAKQVNAIGAASDRKASGAVGEMTQFEMPSNDGRDAVEDGQLHPRWDEIRDSVIRNPDFVKNSWVGPDGTLYASIPYRVAPGTPAGLEAGFVSDVEHGLTGTFTNPNTAEKIKIVVDLRRGSNPAFTLADCSESVCSKPSI